LNPDVLNQVHGPWIFMQKMVALLKLNEMRSLLKIGLFIKRGFLIKGASEAIEEWTRRGSSGSA
jgi:hypothetical protein